MRFKRETEGFDVRKQEVGKISNSGQDEFLMSRVLQTTREREQKVKEDRVIGPTRKERGL